MLRSNGVNWTDPLFWLQVGLILSLLIGWSLYLVNQA